MILKNISHKLKIIALFSVLPIIFAALALVSVGKLRGVWESFIALCAKSWSYFLDFILYDNNVWILLVVIVFSVGFIKGLIFFVSQLRNVHLLRQEFKNKIILQALPDILDNRQIIVVDDDYLFALTVGFVKPVIYISKNMFDTLSLEEIKAVLLHEQYHLENNHSLSLLLANTIRVSFFFIPIVKEIVSYLVLRFEFLADQEAIKGTSRDVLALALLKTFQQGRVGFPVTAVGFSQGADRVKSIIDPTSKPILNLPKYITASSLVVIFLLVFLFFQPQSSQAYVIVNSQAQIDNTSVLGYCYGANMSQLD